MYAYGDFENQLVALVLGLEGVENWRKRFGVELDYPLHQLLFSLSIFMRPKASLSSSQFEAAKLCGGENVFVPSTTAPMTW